jgi:aerobic carbon-monoxide dehydrogenase large subunit
MTDTYLAATATEDVAERAPALIGARVTRVESERLVLGKGCYVDDRHLPGMLHVAFVRSSIPHATITSIDTSAAVKVPGVHLVVTGADAQAALRPIKSRWPLAHDKVRYVGELVAAVVAEDRYIAEDAAELVEVDYELLPPLPDPEAALAAGAPSVFDKVRGNCSYERTLSTPGFDEAFAGAAAVVEITTRSSRAAACPMEPRSYLASWDRGAQSLTLWASSASTFSVRKDVAATLAMSEGRVRVVVADVGGSFGAKNPVYPEELVVAWLATVTERPVKYTELRTEHLQAAHQGRDQRHALRGAFAADGRILAIEDMIIADMGATPTVDNSVDSAMNYVPGAYKVPYYRCTARAVVTNKPPHGSLRGIGKADAAFAIERLMDAAARELGIDRADIRIKNVIGEDEFPYRTVTGALMDSGRYEACLRKALALADYDSMKCELPKLREQGIRRGIGVSLVVEPTSASRRGPGLGFACCRLTITSTGHVVVASGTSQQGQGHETTMGQIVADVLDIPRDQVTVHLSDTESSPYGFTAGSSRSTTVLMSAAYRAAEKAADKLRRIAAHRWEITDDEVRIRSGGAENGRGDRLSLAELLNMAYVRVDQLPPGVEPGFEVLGTFTNPNIDYEPDETGRYNGFATYPYEACVAVVDVDVETGVLAIRKYVSVHDCGIPINPAIVDTQHTGATVQGLGLALLEEIPFDEDGNPMAVSFLDYLLPSAVNLPEELIMDHLVTPAPFTPLGAKGAGETGTLTPPAVLASAVDDAIGPPYGRSTMLPLTPERVLAAVDAARGGAS